MKNIIIYLITIFILTVSLLMLISCNESPNEPPKEMDIEISRSAVKICEATLEISARLSPSDSFSLCFDENNCLEVFHTSTLCNPAAPLVVNGCCLNTSIAPNHITCEYYDPEGADCNDTKLTDHPFVNHPDDWDNLFLKSDMSTSLSITNLSIMYHAYSDYYFVGSDPTGGGPFYSTTLPANAVHDLSSAIEDKRKDTLLAAVGAGISWDDLPVMVQKAAMDIGQSGLKKYSPMTWDRIPTAGGCDEFFNYFAAMYSNNIRSELTERSIFFPWGGTESYFKSDGSLGWTWNGLTISDWIPSGRAAKVVFDEAANCQSISQYYVDTDGNITGTPFVPKIGDYFVRVDNRKRYEEIHSCKDVGGSPYILGSGNACCDAIGVFDTTTNEYLNTRNNTHIMMSLGDTIQPGVVNALCAEFPVIEGSGQVGVRGNACVQTSCHANNLVPCAANFSNVPIHEYYFGEMDIETGGSYSENDETNFGFIAGMPAYI